MKIFNLKDSAGDSFRSKLRRKVDAYEPPLPDSMWDVLSDRLDQRAAERKRLFFYKTVIIASFIMLSGITWMVGSRYAKQNAVKSETSDIQTAVAQTELVGNDNGEEQSTASGYVNQTSVNEEIYLESPNRVGSSGVVSKPKGVSSTPSKLADDEIRIMSIDENQATQPEFNDPPDISDELPEILPSTTAIIFADSLTNGYQASADVLQNLKVPTQAVLSESKFHFGLSGEYGIAYRRFDNPDDKNAAIMNNLESAGSTWALGLRADYSPVRKFRISSGINIRSQNFQLSYDYATVWRKPPPDIPGLFMEDVPMDSAVAGSRYSFAQSYNFIEIPVLVGYSMSLSSKLNILTSAGAGFEWITKSDTRHMDKQGLRLTPEPDARSTANINVTGAIELERKLNNRFGVSLGLVFRHSVSGFYSSSGMPLQYPYSVAMRGGIYFIP